MISKSSASTWIQVRPVWSLWAWSDMAAKIEREMRHAEKVEKKQLHVDVEDIERDATSAAVPDRPPVFG